MSLLIVCVDRAMLGKAGTGSFFRNQAFRHAHCIRASVRRPPAENSKAPPTFSFSTWAVSLRRDAVYATEDLSMCNRVSQHLPTSSDYAPEPLQKDGLRALKHEIHMQRYASSLSWLGGGPGSTTASLSASCKQVFGDGSAPVGLALLVIKCSSLQYRFNA